MDTPFVPGVSQSLVKTQQLISPLFFSLLIQVLAQRLSTLTFFLLCSVSLKPKLLFLSHVTFIIGEKTVSPAPVMSEGPECHHLH